MDSAGRRKAVGSLLVVTVASLWIAASFVVSNLAGERNVSFVAITYISNATFILNLTLVPKLPKASFTRCARAALAVAPLWFAAQLTFNWSLALTSVPSNTILSTTSCVFALIISRALLRERASSVKTASAAATVTGVALIVANDTFATHSNVFGDILAIGSAALYACHTTLLKRMLGESTLQIVTFFGLVGLFNALLGLPLLLGTYATGSLNIDALDTRAVLLIIGKGLVVNVLSDALWAKAVALTSPTFATIGTTLDVPMSVVIQAIISKPDWLSDAKAALLKFCGVLIVLLGFFGINASDSAFSYSASGSSDMSAPSAAAERPGVYGAEKQIATVDDEDSIDKLEQETGERTNLLGVDQRSESALR
jgi:solute carrier family 35 protein F5